MANDGRTDRIEWWNDDVSPCTRLNIRAIRSLEMQLDLQIDLQKKSRNWIKFDLEGPDN